MEHSYSNLNPVAIHPKIVFDQGSTRISAADQTTNFGSLMSYATISIGEILGGVNQKYFLPAIQRPYVWQPHHIVTLIDSLLKGYPISSFMFWDVDAALKGELQIYNFIEAWHPEMQNPSASTDGRDVVLVLDGQQRITSLLIATRGSYAEKAKYKRRNDPTAWVEKTLYLDLFKDPADAEEEEADLGVSYGLHFHAHPPRSDYRNCWFRIGDILNHPSPEQLEELVENIQAKMHHGATPYQHELAETTLRRLHEVIWSEKNINYFTETSSSIDRVLDIFVRANDGGVKLSKSDLMMSMITSKWSKGSARDEVFGFVSHINKDLGSPNSINKDFVLKACLVLCDFDVRYNVSNFSSEAIAQIESKWPAIKDTVERTFRFLNSLGISKENLTSLNAVLPIAYFLFHSPGLSMLGTSMFERSNARAMQRWLINSLLMGVFAGTSDRTIGVARASIRDAMQESREFPETELYRALAIGGRMTQLDERAVEELFELGYGKSKTFLALSLIYDDLDWNGTQFHVDHIIPKSHAAKRVLMGMNLPEHRVQEISSAVDRLGNLQLLSAQDNMEKGDISFESWVTGRGDTYRARHLIENSPDLWMATMLPDFVRSREKLIRNKLLTLAQRAPA